MAEGAISVVERRLEQAAGTDPWWQEARARAEADGARALPVLFPALARRLGRALIGGGRVAEDSLTERGRAAVVDLDAWRVCDAGGFVLMRRAADLRPEHVVDLFLHGDFEERSIVMRARGLAPVDEATTRLYGEAQRTNTATHFEAFCCESNLAARAVGADGFGIAELNRLVLKTAFLDLPLARMLQAEEHANEELSLMLQGLATEREAAGRKVWADTDRLLGLAPTRGTVLRLVGGLEHGSDGRRRLAAEALGRMDRQDLTALVVDRAEREPVAEVADLLRVLAEKWSG